MTPAVRLDRAAVQEWVEAYVRAWRTPGTQALASVFTTDLTYSPSPWRQTMRGLDDLARFWDAERDGPDERFDLSSEVVALDPPHAVVRLAVDYGSGSRWRDLWVLRFAEPGGETDGDSWLVEAYEEWPFAPTQRDGHEP